ncbi:hypothetical protein BGZ61DRAFT_470794 [Ilyonectria robusta]|uniref:uncharacterized protein n=1 Tax=Ilyonectria robusta TaxID=1079257 RepID=UPI001E8DAC53|nr:uncharacterized protein BGZ61DRAFT_470794 [Ilyonectria robusta]KAH8737334.1 hypothetical protein BGZ61DRAFT_470794 [Ilyonectria robusta]
MEAYSAGWVMFDNQATGCLLSSPKYIHRSTYSVPTYSIPPNPSCPPSPQPGLLVPSPAPARPSPSIQPIINPTRHDQADQARHQASALIVPAAQGHPVSHARPQWSARLCPHSFALGPFLPSFQLPALCFLASPPSACTPSLTTTLTPSSVKHPPVNRQTTALVFACWQSPV